MHTRLEHGVTLLECLVVMLLLVIMVGVSSNLAAWIARHRLITFQHDVYRSLMVARHHAINYGVDVVVCPLGNDGGCAMPSGNWSNGWRVFETEGEQDCQPKTGGLCHHGGRILVEQAPVRKGFHIAVNSHLARRARFDAMGMSHGYNGRLTVCSRQNVTPLGLVISQSGRVRKAEPEELLPCDAGSTP